jgi:hypothetical protein
MRKVLSVLMLLLGTALGVQGADVVHVAPWDLHSSFWVSLHQTLIDDATRETARDLKGFTDAERTAWGEAVAAYRAAGGKGELTFAKPMQITSDALSQVADDAPDPVIDAPLSDALKRAAPVYRAHGWAEDDRAARFFISYAAGLLRDAGPELVRAHEKVYGAAWPEHIALYVTPHAGPYGAYTMKGLSGGWITTMSCRDAGYQGFRALEMVLHESSHAIVGPNNGRVAEAIAAAGKKRGLDRPPHDLWHAILFSTSSELTRRALVARGVVDFVPSSEDLFTRAWPFYRKPVEDGWLPYLDGRGTLEDAIDKVVAGIKR